MLYETAMFFLLLVRWVSQKGRNPLGRGFPKRGADSERWIWIHAVSVGETKAAVPLVKQLQKEFPNASFLITNVTDTGHREAKRALPFVQHHFLPVDCRWIIGPIMEKLKPAVVLVIESDFWLNFLREARRVGAQVFLINGKMSERSTSRFQRAPRFAKKLFSTFDHLFVQSERYKKRFLSLGVKEDTITCSGNTKLDATPPTASPEALTEWKGRFHLDGNPVLVIGSSHDPEEKAFLESLERVWKEKPTLKVLLVPRHPERFDQVANLLKERKIPFGRYSGKVDEGAQVILIDAMGKLCTCYQLATIAVVAGSYTSKVGGHNIVEPSFFGVPVLYGPEMHSQLDLVSLVEEYGAGKQVPLDELSSALLKWLDDAETREKVGEAGKRLCHDARGATEKTWKALSEMQAFDKLVNIPRGGAGVSSLGS